MKALSTGILLAFLTLSCGHRSQPTSAVQSLASHTNETLVSDILQKEEIPLATVLERREAYGLGEKDLEIIRAAFPPQDQARLVLRVVDPNGLKGQVAPRWAFIPEVDDDGLELTAIEVMDASGAKTIIDGTKDSQLISYPLITLTFSEKLEGAVALNLRDAAPASVGSLMLNRIEFKDVQEPWIKGDAEIYGVVSYIGKDGKGASLLVELPSVVASQTSYELRQILHLWPENRYQILNVAFFEHDTGTNYASLAKVFISAAASIVTSVLDPTQTTTIAIAGIIGQLAGKIVDALPEGSLTDDDDYLDTVNTIEKYGSGLRAGASGNVKADFLFYEVKINDE